MPLAQPETYLADLNEAQRRGRHDDRGAGARDRRRGLRQDARAHLPRRAPAHDAGRRAERDPRDHVHEQGRAGDARADRGGARRRARGAIWILTFHAACGRILRREAERLGYRSNFTIYDQADQIRLVKDCLEELERDPKRFAPRGIHTQISNAKNQLIGPDEYASRVASFYDQTVADVYGLYQRRLFASNAVDFDDLLMLTVDVLQRFPEARERWAKAFRYVLVDEYQDTNHAQYVLLQLLAGEHQNLMVVGDPDQCLVAGTLVTMADGDEAADRGRPRRATRCSRVTAAASSGPRASRVCIARLAARRRRDHDRVAAGASSRRRSTCTSPGSRTGGRRSST